MNFCFFGTMRACTLSQLVLLTVFLISVPDIRAEIVTFQFEGELSQVDAPLQGTFSIGDSFSGSYTFDSDEPFPPECEEYPELCAFLVFKNSISAMSFSSGAYMATANNGDITQDFDDSFDIRASFSSISGSSAESFVPDRIRIQWVSSGFGNSPEEPLRTLRFGAMIQPGFDPNLPPYEILPYGPYFDADGNLIYSHERGLIGDPNQPLFSSDGSPGIANGDFILVLLDADGQQASVSGKLSSVLKAINTDDGLVAHWPLDEGSGRWVDDVTGNKHDGVLNRGLAWNGNDLLFDGIDDYINVGSLGKFEEDGGKKLSLAAWVRSAELNNCRSRDCRIISKAKGTAEQDHIWMLSTIKVGNKTRLRFRLQTITDGRTSTLIASSGDLTDGELFHAAATYDGVTMRLYKNGVEVGILSKSGLISDNSIGVSVWIGGNPSVATSRPWKGLISDVRVYQKALTEEELEAVMEDRP